MLVYELSDDHLKKIVRTKENSFLNMFLNMDISTIINSIITFMALLIVLLPLWLSSITFALCYLL